MITVLRLGHRVSRDKRISTHLGLVARTFGAQKIVYTGERDSTLLESLKKVAKQWGGPFEAEHAESWRDIVKSFKGKIVHLTMYGSPLKEKYGELTGDLLVVVGGEKVPAEMYELADYNIGVGNQPHSEVAALGIFLREVAEEPEFKDAKQKVIPSEKGKRLEKV